MEILLPKRVSWSTGKETYDPGVRAMSAESDLRELLTQYKEGHLLPESGNLVTRRFKNSSGWLGSIPKEELVRRYDKAANEGLPFDEEFEFDEVGAPPRLHVLSPEEEQVFKGVWKEEPNVDDILHSRHSPTVFRQKATPMEIVEFKIAAESPENSGLRDQVIETVVGLIEKIETEPGVLIRQIPDMPQNLLALSRLQAFVEQAGQKVAAFVSSSIDFADARTLSEDLPGIRWQGQDLRYFGVPVWHTHQVNPGTVVALSDDDRVVVVQTLNQ